MVQKIVPNLHLNDINLEKHSVLLPFLSTFLIFDLGSVSLLFIHKFFYAFIIVAFLENATIGYSLESLCVCLCVFLHDNSKRNRSRNTKSEYIVVYENSSDKFDIELHRIKVKVTVGVQKFSPFTTIQTVRSYSSTLVQARNLILSIYLHLILIYKIYECRHA